MDFESIRNLFDEERRTLEPSDVRREVAGPVVRHISRYSTESGIAFSDLDDTEVSKVIEEEVAYFTSIGHICEWKTYSHDRPNDLVARLENVGFSMGQTEVVLIAEASGQVSSSFECPVEVRRLTNPDELDDYVIVSSKVWGNRTASRIIETMRSDPRSLGVYVAYWSGEPVGSARSSFDSNSAFSGLWGGAVIPEYRGKGVYRAMIRHRALDAQSFGARYLVVDALPTSQPILERLGFERLSTTTPCVWGRPTG